MLNYQRVNEIKFIDSVWIYRNGIDLYRLGACPVAPEDNLICPHPWGFICRDVIQKWQNIDFYVFFKISSRVIWTSYSAYANCSCPITRKTKPLCRESCPQRAFLGDVSATDKKWEEAQPLPRLQASLESRCASRPPKSLRSHQKADGQEAQWIQWDWGSNRCYSWHSWELHWNILESILKFGWHAITKVLFRFLLFSKLIV